MTGLSDSDIAFLRQALTIAEANDYGLYQGSGQAMAFDLEARGFMQHIEAIDVFGAPTNYWSISRKGIAELKRIDARLKGKL